MYEVLVLKTICARVQGEEDRVSERASEKAKTVVDKNVAKLVR